MLCLYADFLKNILIGFAVAAPLGPVALLVAQRVLNHQVFPALWAGAGAALADIMWAGCAVWGLGILLPAFQQIFALMRFGGGLVLIGIGAWMCFRPVYPISPVPKTDTVYAWGSFFSGWGLTILNPLTLLAFAAFFSMLNMESACTQDPWLMIAAIGLGASCWWALLTLLILVLRKRFGLTDMERINKILGLVMMGCGVVACVQCVIH